MTKKHFIALADMIAHHNAIIDRAPGSGWTSLVFHQSHINALADFCASQNRHFDRARWLNYIAGECGPNGGRK